MSGAEYAPYCRGDVEEYLGRWWDEETALQQSRGLQEYYQTHWVRMGMERAERQMRVMVLFVLVEIGAAVPAQVVADVLDEDIADVQNVLDEWREYLKLQREAGEDCHSFYHASFPDFLSRKLELKRTRKLFCEVNQRIADYQEWEVEQ